MQIELDGLLIDIELIYKPHNRGIYFRYLGNNKYRVTTPYKYSYNQMCDLILKNKNKFLKLMKTKEIETDNNHIHYFGKLIEIKYIESNINKIYLTDEFLVINYKNEKYISKMIKDFYVSIMEEYTKRVFDNIFLKFSDLKIKKPTIKFKYTKTFYGKCFRSKNLIELSGICVKMEPKYIDTVIYHELCHFKYLGHQKNFYNYFESKLLNAKKLQHEFRMLKYKDFI